MPRPKGSRGHTDLEELFLKKCEPTPCKFPALGECWIWSGAVFAPRFEGDPLRGQMKGATQSRPMLVAHEAQEHTPYAVTGEKDAVNEDGTPKYQQMDVSALVPLLLAELQSLRKRVAELESK